MPDSLRFCQPLPEEDLAVSQQKINLIYVASIGRSGSTLLESILGAHSQIATCGEIHIWPHEILQKGVRPCICGKSVLKCPVWTEVLKQVNPLQQPLPQIHFFREQHHAGHTLRASQLKIFGKQPLSAQAAAKIQQYGQNNYAVFDAFLNVMRSHDSPQLNWVVDSSKDPYRLLWLARSGYFNVKVLHIVRNPPAFVYSMVKRLPKEIATVPHQRLYEAARQSVKWSIENALISKVAANHLDASSYQLVKYEALAAEPTATFQQICRFLGCDFEASAIANFREGSKHTIAGNPMRYEARGISLDEKWKTLLPGSLRKVAKTLTLVNRSDYGY